MKFKVKVLCAIIAGLLIFSYGTQAQTTNANFEAGNFTSWTGTYYTGCDTVVMGICACSVTNPTRSPGFNQGPNNDPPSDALHQYNQIITTAAGGNDPNLAGLGATLPTVWLGSGTYSARIGNMWQTVGSGDGDGETISYTFLVTQANSNFTYHYAVVLNDGGHTSGEQPYFNIKMVDGSGNHIPFADFQVDATTAATIGGFNHISNAYLYWKPWSSVVLPLSSYIGQTVTITFTTRSCLPSGCSGSHYAYAYIDCESAPGYFIQIAQDTVCASQKATLKAPPYFATYSWAGPGIISAIDSQTININQPGHYTVTMTANDSLHSVFILDTILAANFNSATADFSAQAACLGNPTAFTDSSTPHGSITSWAWDFNNDGVTDAFTPNPSYTFSSAGTFPVKLTITSSLCIKDTTINVVVSVPPTSTFTATALVCEGQNSTITYTGNGSNIDVYTWGVSGGSIASGTGSGPYQVNWPTGGTKNISLIVAEGNCSSTITTVPVVVNVTPNANFTVSVSPLCAGQNEIVTYTGSATNTAFYTWNFSGATVISGVGSGPYVINWDTTFAGTQVISLAVGDNNCVSIPDSVPVSVQICNGIETVAAGEVAIYPNPAKNDFTIQATGAISNGQLEIYDVLGQRLYREEIKNVSTGFSKQIHLDVATGVYFVSIHSGDRHLTQKLVIE